MNRPESRSGAQWARWPALTLPAKEKLFAFVELGIELALSPAGSTPTVDVSCFSIKRSVRAIRKGRTREFVVSTRREAVGWTRATALLDGQAVTVTSPSMEATRRAQLQGIELLGVLTRADKATSERLSSAGDIVVDAGEAIVTLEGIGDIQAICMSNEDLAVLAILAGWPFPAKLKGKH